MIEYSGIPSFEKLGEFVPQTLRNAIGESITNCKTAVAQLRQLKSGYRADEIETNRIYCNLLNRNGIAINDAIQLLLRGQ